MVWLPGSWSGSGSALRKKAGSGSALKPMQIHNTVQYSLFYWGWTFYDLILCLPRILDHIYRVLLLNTDLIIYLFFANYATAYFFASVPNCGKIAAVYCLHNLFWLENIQHIVYIFPAYQLPASSVPTVGAQSIARLCQNLINCRRNIWAHKRRRKLRFFLFERS